MTAKHDVALRRAAEAQGQRMGDAPTIFLLTPFIISWQLTEDEALLGCAKGRGITTRICWSRRKREYSR